MIHKTDKGICISSRGQWLPGIYADERAARLAFKLDDETRNGLALASASVGQPISHRLVLAVFRRQAVVRKLGVMDNG